MAFSRESSAQRGYNSRWQKAREAFLLSHPLCVMHKARGLIISATVVDHIKPPRMADALRAGIPEQIAQARALFWDTENWQALCKDCHDSDKQRMERTGAVIGCGVDGIPLDPSHHWNRR